MKNSIDWYYLQKPIMLFLASMTISVAISFAGDYYESIKLDDYQQSVATLRSTHNLYRNMVNDLDLLELYRTKFSEYKSNGLVGDERRLSWIESLKSTNEVLKLPSLSYSLLPQQDFKRPGFKPKRNVIVKSSPMQLTMGILHEEDLFAVLEGLRLSIDSLFTVDSCEIRRLIDVRESLDTKHANLQSNCMIRWVTVNGS